MIFWSLAALSSDTILLPKSICGVAAESTDAIACSTAALQWPQFMPGTFRMVVVGPFFRLPDIWDAPALEGQADGNVILHP